MSDNNVTVSNPSNTVIVRDKGNRVVVSPDPRPTLTVSDPPTIPGPCCPGGGQVIEVGVPGPAGSATASFVFEQSTPSTTWDIVHTLHKYPSVMVVDSGKTVVIGSINYVSDSHIIITFTVAFSGWAYLT